jgi:hypothetical protein
MRSVRRGMIAAALALPLAFGFAGVAGASEGEGSVDWASYEAGGAVATPWGAAAGEIESEALHAVFESNGDDNGDHKDKDGKHGDKRGDHDNGKHENGEKEVSYASFEAEGAAASFLGAAAGELEAEAFHGAQD